jgi:hypothetical protein
MWPALWSTGENIYLSKEEKDILKKTQMRINVALERGSSRKGPIAGNPLRPPFAKGRIDDSLFEKGVRGISGDSR